MLSRNNGIHCILDRVLMYEYSIFDFCRSEIADPFFHLASTCMIYIYGYMQLECDMIVTVGRIHRRIKKWALFERHKFSGSCNRAIRYSISIWCQQTCIHATAVGRIYDIEGDTANIEMGTF